MRNQIINHPKATNFSVIIMAIFNTIMLAKLVGVVINKIFETNLIISNHSWPLFFYSSSLLISLGLLSFNLIALPLFVHEAKHNFKELFRCPPELAFITILYPVTFMVNAMIVTSLYLL